MARRSRMSIVKRQRELKKAEKAARKRAKRHGIVEEGFTEPVPTGRAALGLAPPPSDEPLQPSLRSTNPSPTPTRPTEPAVGAPRGLPRIPR